MTKSNKINRYGLWALLLIALLPAGAAAQKVNQGIDMSTTTGLFSPNNFIYLGHYEHALAFDAANSVTQRESSPTPILWRVNGLDDHSNISPYSCIALMSEYVLDSKKYEDGSTDKAWPASSIFYWLRDNFKNNFTSTEFGQVRQGHVNDMMYKLSNGDLSSLSGTNTPFYLLWGTPSQSTHSNRNKLFWSRDRAGTSFVIDESYMKLDDEHRVATLKGGIPGIGGVSYWLRPPLESMTAQKLYVQPHGTIDINGFGVLNGVRPLCILDTAKVLFAAELQETNGIDRVDQIVADNAGIYTAEDAIPGGGAGKSAYKLTLLNTTLTPITQLDYDYDESVAGITDTVALKPSELLPLSVTPAGISAAGLAYKVVSNPNRLRHYNYTAGTGTLSVLADDIYTPTVIGVGGTPVANLDYQPLPSGTMHTVYAWSQNNNATQSHEGSALFAFTMRVLNDNVTPTLTPRGAFRASNTNATVYFDNQETNARGKYYYIVDPLMPPSGIMDFVPNPAPQATRQNFNLTPGIDRDSIVLTTLPNTDDPHTIYIIAKDLVRNVSNMIAVTIPRYEAPVAPVAVSPLPVARIEAGKSVIFTADTLATDANMGDVLTITTITTYPVSTIASAVLTADKRLQMLGTAPGKTTVSVDIKDLYPPHTLPVTVDIHVLERTPQITVDYVNECLRGFDDGQTYSFDGGTAVTMGEASDSIQSDWFDATVEIVKVNADPDLNSSPQKLYIPARPPYPPVYAENETVAGFNDGMLMNLNDSMEYRAEGDEEWIQVPLMVKYITDLSPGKYQVRYRVIAGVQFAGEPRTLTIDYGVVIMSPLRAIYLPVVSGMTSTPKAGVHYALSIGDFTFSLKFSGSPLRVKTSRVFDGVQEHLTGTPNADGGYDYLIRNVNTSIPTVVYIGPEPEANEDVETPLVWSYGGQIYIEAWREDTIAIYALSGLLVKQMDVSEGVTSVTVAPGVYVVTRKDGARHKVLVQ